MSSCEAHHTCACGHVRDEHNAAGECQVVTPNDGDLDDECPCFAFECAEEDGR